MTIANIVAWATLDAGNISGVATLEENARFAASKLDGRGSVRPLIYGDSHPRPLDEYHEDDGPVVWWAWDGENWFGEPAWIGTPQSDTWPGYHTHWTPHPAMPERPVVPSKPVTAQQVADGLEALLNELARNVCTHEETYRGGAIWEICRACGAKWADDEGGKPAHTEPEAVTRGYELLTALRAAAKKESDA